MLSPQRTAKNLFIALFLTALTAPLCAQRTYTASSCSRADVQAAINQHLGSPADGDIISIPAGTCTWTGSTDVSASFTRSVTIQGAGAQYSTDGGAGTTGTDRTAIICNVSGGGCMSFRTVAGKSLRITGIAMSQNGSSTSTNHGVIGITGSSTAVRIDHSHFHTIAGNTFIGVSGRVTGVIDHVYFTSPADALNTVIFPRNGQSWNGNTENWGDASWADGNHWGTEKFLYIEDCRFFEGDLGDGHDGARYVLRYSTVTGTTRNHGQWYNHGLNADRGRSVRAVEIYGNNIVRPGVSQADNPFYSINGGSLLFWGNTVTNYSRAVEMDYTRKDDSTYGYDNPPAGWGNCNAAGSRTNWDASSPGYPCMDQVGRGAGRLLSGYFPSVENTGTSSISYHNQELSPVYYWRNTITGGGGLFGNGFSAGYQENRDYYQDNPSFGGTSGVGIGLLSARPSTCTAGPGGNTPGVGYWATDRNTLYVCTATNTWTAYYTPYTYPHPLQSGGTSLPNPPTDTTPPSTPSTLTATAISSSGINLSWTASTDNVGVTGYRVERCQGASCANFAQIATPSSNSHSDSGLSASTVYRYRVRGTDVAGNLSSYSSIASATTQAAGGAQPPLPTGNSGIAAQFPNDANIQSQANVLFADGFETYTSPSQLTSSGNYTNYWQDPYVTLDTSTFFSGTKSARLRVPATSSGFGNGIEKRLSPEQDTLFMRVYTRFQPNYGGLADAHNGLLISGRYPGPGIRPNGTDFFLVLIENSRYLAEGEPGYTNAYVYHPEQDDLYGEHWYPDGFVSNGAQNFGPTFIVRPKVIPARGQWVSYELMVKLNTPGQRDGRVAVWQDGNLIADWQNLRFRDVPTVRIDQISLGNGGKSSSQQNDKWYDNLVLATSYIGPMSTGSQPPGSQPAPPTNLVVTVH